MQKETSMKTRYGTAGLTALAGFACLGIAQAGDKTNDGLGAKDFTSRPAFLAGEPARKSYDGVTAGLHTGSATTLLGMLVFTVPVGTEPTPEALRTLQIKGSY